MVCWWRRDIICMIEQRFILWSIMEIQIFIWTNVFLQLSYSNSELTLARITAKKWRVVLATLIFDQLWQFTEVMTNSFLATQRIGKVQQNQMFWLFLNSSRCFLSRRNIIKKTEIHMVSSKSVHFILEYWKCFESKIFLEFQE